MIVSSSKGRSLILFEEAYFVYKACPFPRIAYGVDYNFL